MLSWMRASTEYAIGAALVLLHLALAGRRPMLGRALDDELRR